MIYYQPKNQYIYTSCIFIRCDKSVFLYYCKILTFKLNIISCILIKCNDKESFITVFYVNMFSL